MANHIVKSDSTDPQQGNAPAGNQPPTEKQYIPKQGEEYLRESGKIEDYPAPDGSRAPNVRPEDRAETYGARRAYDSIY